jgi:hypothetical protein
LRARMRPIFLRTMDALDDGLEGPPRMHLLFAFDHPEIETGQQTEGRGSGGLRGEKRMR